MSTVIVGAVKKEALNWLRLLCASRRTARASAENASLAQSALNDLLGESKANRLVIRYIRLTERWRKL